MKEFLLFFPNQWIRSCVAFDSSSGLINWVVEGRPILLSEKLKSPLNFPKNLGGKLIMGALSFGGKWKSVSSNLTNLNIFSSALPIEKMKNMTGGNNCVEKGDYLAWEDMEWLLHGKANLDTVTALEEPCDGEPLVNLYNANFPGMDSCKHHCENSGSRAPSVVAFGDWINLQSFLNAKVNIMMKDCKFGFR